MATRNLESKRASPSETQARAKSFAAAAKGPSATAAAEETEVSFRSPVPRPPDAPSVPAATAAAQARVAASGRVSPVIAVGERVPRLSASAAVFPLPPTAALSLAALQAQVAFLVAEHHRARPVSSLPPASARPRGSVSGPPAGEARAAHLGLRSLEPDVEEEIEVGSLLGGLPDEELPLPGEEKTHLEELGIAAAHCFGPTISDPIAWLTNLPGLSVSQTRNATELRLLANMLRLLDAGETAALREFLVRRMIGVARVEQKLWDFSMVSILTDPFICEAGTGMVLPFAALRALQRQALLQRQTTAPAAAQVAPSGGETWKERKARGKLAKAAAKTKAALAPSARQ